MNRPTLALAALSCMSTASAQDFVSGEVAMTSTAPSGGEVTLPYQLLSPKTVEEGERYPLILFLHGAGERGSDNATQLKHFPSKMLTPERREAFPCFVLAPQCPEGQKWTTDEWGSKTSQRIPEAPTAPLAAAVAALLDVAARYPVDLDRIYLTGLSMGGYGAFELAARHPDWFAAAAPVCGGGDDEAVDRLVGLPLSIWHGDADGAVPVERSRSMVAALKALGTPVEYHELPGVGHAAWTAAYGAQGCLDWMFSQRRDPARRAALAGELMARSLKDTDRVAFLGDSITQAGAEPGGYVDILRAAMKRARPKATVIPAGISGHRVPDLLKREEADVRAKGATLVFLYIGINDVWHTQSGHGTPKAEFASGLDELLIQLEGPGEATVAIATPSVIGEGPLGASPLDALLAEYSEVTRGLASGGHRSLCDLQVRFREHLLLFNPGGETMGVLTSDGVHLNSAGNQFLAAEAALAIRRAALSR